MSSFLSLRVATLPALCLAAMAVCAAPAMENRAWHRSYNSQPTSSRSDVGLIGAELARLYCAL